MIYFFCGRNINFPPNLFNLSHSGKFFAAKTMPSHSKSSKSNSDASSSNRERSRSPVRESGFSKEEMVDIMKETMAAQIPRLILETSKVVQEQLAADQQESQRSFTAFSLEMKKLKLRQEEVAAQGKASAFKGDGGQPHY